MSKFKLGDQVTLVDIIDGRAVRDGRICREMPRTITVICSGYSFDFTPEGTSKAGGFTLRHANSNRETVASLDHHTMSDAQINQVAHLLRSFK